MANNKYPIVLFITVRADFGGGPEHLWQLLKHKPEEMRACVACPRDYPYYDRFRSIVGDENIIEIPHRKFTIATLWKLFSFCRRRGVNVLHSHGKGGGAYSRLISFINGADCVHTFHGVHVKGYGPVGKFLYQTYERVLSLLTDVAISVSQGECDEIIRLGFMPESKLRMIPNGVPIPEKPNCDLLAYPFPVISITRFDYAKNSPFLLEILLALKQFGRLDDFQFILVGDGPDKDSMVNEVVKKDIIAHLKFVGSHDTPQTFFKGALCYLSTSRWEGMPLAVLEAMSFGLPAVVTDVTGNNDLVENEYTGFLYTQGDAASAAERLCILADDTEKRRILGQQARRAIQQNYDVKLMAARTMKVLEDVVVERNRKIR